jgi:hypothetical protein
MELTIYNVYKGEGKELCSKFYVPFSSTTIRAVSNNAILSSQEYIGFDIVVDQVSMTKVYQLNQFKSKEANLFYLVDEKGEIQQKYEEFLLTLLNSIGTSNSGGNVVNFSDLLGNVNELKNKNVFQAKFVSSLQRYYIAQMYEPYMDRWFDVKCASLGIDFTGFEFNPCYQYVLLIDTYKRKKYKKTNRDTGVRKYSKSKYKHADQISMRDTNRINEIYFDPFKDNVCYFDFNQHNYFNAYSPYPTGIGKKYRKLNLGFRLRIIDREQFKETDYICFCKMLMNKNKKGIEGISFCK